MKPDRRDIFRPKRRVCVVLPVTTCQQQHKPNPTYCMHQTHPSSGHEPTRVPIATPVIPCCVYNHPVKLHAGPIEMGDATLQGGGLGQLELDVVEAGATVSRCELHGTPGYLHQRVRFAGYLRLSKTTTRTTINCGVTAALILAYQYIHT